LFRLIDRLSRPADRRHYSAAANAASDSIILCRQIVAGVGVMNAFLGTIIIGDAWEQ